MIRKYVYGKPYKTIAVVKEVDKGGELDFLKAEEYNGGLKFSCELDKSDVVYGLGETMRGINKRGGKYISFNTDDSHHTSNTKSLYGSHNLIVVDGKKRFGVFFDTPSKITFEIDLDNSGKIDVISESMNIELYLIEGDSAYEIVKEFLSIIGRSYIPPLWAFGYGQSRWGYKCEKDIDKVVEGYEKAQIPIDYICMDIDYMDRYIDFTVDKQRFPDLKKYAAKLKNKGIRLVPIIDAGVKIEEGNEVYEEGVKKGYFCTNMEGKNFQAAVWPGLTHFPDFFQKDARAWFGSKYKALTDCGIDGFWNDMNEPSIFYSEYSAKQNGFQMLIGFLFPKTNEDKSATNAYKDYKHFYHNIEGKRVLHYDVHNEFGALMTMSASEELDKLLDKRFLLFSRSSYVGAHRYGGIWTGDNSSTFEHLRQNVYQMPSLNMCGFLYSSADTGGFGGNTTRELLLRWLAFSLFTPLYRNHTSIMTKRQEAYKFSKVEDFKKIIALRYRLLPYIYSEYVKAALSNDMYIKPLAFCYPDDEKAKVVEDQLIVGDSIMVAPVIEQGAKGRKVYLPEDMTEVRFDGDKFTCVQASKGEKETAVALNEVVFYIRKNKLVPIAKKLQNASQIDLADVSLLGDGESYLQYIDDGFTKTIDENNIRILKK